MIDKKYQHKGYGKEAMIKAIEFLRTKSSGDAEYITLSYERTNEVAKKLYFSLGFYEPEEFAPYYEEDDEIFAICKF
ncbi:MAG: GNAT family N-acetyltransferase [Bacilli bacterium]|nr:GNAT family N-acetyltransferase [Bacilli bacterium]